MKTLIVYFSYAGNTALAAEHLKAALNAETLELKLSNEKKRTKPGKFFWAMSLMFSKKAMLKPYNVDINAYDLVVLGTPVWGGHPSPVIAAFLNQTKFHGKKIALLCCHASGPGKVFDEFTTLLPENTIIGKIDLHSPSKMQVTELKQKIDEWVKLLC